MDKLSIMGPSNQSDSGKSNDFVTLLLNATTNQPDRLMNELMKDIPHMPETSQAKFIVEILKSDITSEEEAELLKDSAKMLSETMTDKSFKNMLDTVLGILDEFTVEQKKKQASASSNVSSAEDEIDKELYGTSLTADSEPAGPKHSGRDSAFTVDSFEGSISVNEFSARESSILAKLNKDKSSTSHRKSSSKHSHHDHDHSAKNTGKKTTKEDYDSFLAYIKRKSGRYSDDDDDDTHRRRSSRSSERDRYKNYSPRYSRKRTAEERDSRHRRRY